MVAVACCFDRALVVDVNCDSRCVVVDLPKEFEDPEEILASLRESNVFRFVGGSCDGALSTAGPDDRASMNVDDEASGGTASVVITRIVCVGPSFDERGVATSTESYAVVSGADKIAKDAFDSGPMDCSRIGVEPGDNSH